MESIRLKGTDDTPEVILDKENNIFKISGKSLPEDINRFYSPIINWINKYILNPNKNTEVVFKMEYFNTASSKKILDILEVFEIIYLEHKEISIKWLYHKDDDDMLKAGESFFKIVDIPSEIIAYD